jgi:undecaprenyl-diphosphatase
MLSVRLARNCPDKEMIEPCHVLGAFAQETSHSTTVARVLRLDGGIPGLTQTAGDYDECMIRVLRPRQRPSWQIVAPALLLLGAFAVPGGLIMAGQGEPAFNRIDTTWQAYSFTLHAPFWDAVNVVLNWAGYTGALVSHLVLAAALLIWQRPRAAAFSALAGLSALGLTQLAKALVGRDRPQGAKVLSDTGSYPSGHVSATTAFLVVMALLIGQQWAKVVAVLGILAMMVSRTYLSAHWLSDVLGGACLAAGVVLLLWWPFCDICIQENEIAGRTTIWRARALQRQQEAGQQE